MAVGRSNRLNLTLSPDTFVGAVKLAAENRNVTLASLSERIGLKPDSLRARLSISRGKRSLQPHQVSKIADALGLDEAGLHRLAAKHEGWKL